MRLYLGTHMVSQEWWDAGVPLFVSRRRLTKRRTLPQASSPWALDSGGFTEIEKHGRWVTGEDEYVAEVERFAAGIGRLEWIAPQDWMCEPFMLARTGLTVAEHQRRTVASVLSLRARLGSLVVPVLQGFELDDYLRCVELYERAGVVLVGEPVVGLGSICRRQDMAVVGRIVLRLHSEGLALHGFGVKATGIASYGRELESADSTAWSYNGRMHPGKCPEGRRACGNCLHHALSWHRRTFAHLDQLRMEVPPCVVV